MIGDDDRLHLFARDEIDEITYADKSLMPTDYNERLSAAEYQNLMAFLSCLSLRGRDSE